MLTNDTISISEYMQRNVQMISK